MKYTIQINQLAVIREGLKLDIIDLAIFDFIRDFANSIGCERITTPEGVYFWISHSIIIEQLPIIGIKSPGGIIKRIDNLVTSGLLEKHPECSRYSKSMYCFGSMYDKYIMTPLPDNDTPSLNGERVSAPPLPENVTPSLKRESPPPQKGRE